MLSLFRRSSNLSQRTLHLNQSDEAILDQDGCLWAVEPVSSDLFGVKAEGWKKIEGLTQLKQSYLVMRYASLKNRSLYIIALDINNQLMWFDKNHPQGIKISTNVENIKHLYFWNNNDRSLMNLFMIDEDNRLYGISSDLLVNHLGSSSPAELRLLCSEVKSITNLNCAYVLWLDTDRRITKYDNLGQLSDFTVPCFPQKLINEFLISEDNIIYHLHAIPSNGEVKGKLLTNLKSPNSSQLIIPLLILLNIPLNTS